MDKNEIKELLLGKVHSIKKLCRHILPGFDPEDIHKFRVEIKKLRAFLRFLETIPEQPEINIPRKLKQLYSIAGIIRDHQLQLAQLDVTFSKTPAYKAYLNRIITIQKREWDRDYSDDVCDSLEEKIKEAELHKLTDTDLNDFAGKYITAIKNLSLNSPDEEEIHAVRKHVKDMLYNIKYAEENWPAAIRHLHTTPINKLEQLSDLIGTYHDTVVMRDHLLVFIATPHAAEETHTIERLIKQKEDQILGSRPRVLELISTFTTAAKD